MYLSKRTILLFHTLSKSEGPLTSNYLSQVVGVTSRTVKKDLQVLGEIIASYGAKLCSKPGRGYQIYVDDERSYQELVRLMEQNDLVADQNIPRYSYERVNYIIKKLLIVDYYIKFEDFMEELYVGRSTITNDMKTVRENLQQYGLKLIHTPSRGTIITGKESAKRQCIAEYFFHNAVGERFYVKDNIMFNSNQNQKELAHLRHELLSVLMDYHIHLSDLSVENLMIHIAVMMRRLTFSNYVECSEEQMSYVADTPEWEAALKYCGILEDVLDMDIPRSEVVYLTMHLISKHINEQMDVSAKRQNDLREVIIKGLRAVKKQYRIDLCGDLELIDLLILHLEPMIRRIQMGMVMRNPLAYESTIRYLYASWITAGFCREIEASYHIHIDFNEFGYLVLYFNMAVERCRNAEVKKVALVCGRGRPEMITILSQMKEALAKYHVTFTMMDTYQIPQINVQDYYLIISTVPLELPKSAPLIVLHAFDESEIHTVKHFYQYLEFKDIPFSRYLKSSRVVSLRGEHIHAVLKSFSRILEKRMDDSAGKWNQINEMPLCISDNHIAVLLNGVDAAETSFLIGKLEKPIEKDHHIIQVIICVQCAACDMGWLSGILYVLSKWIRDEEQVNSFFKDSSISCIQKQFLDIIERE